MSTVLEFEEALERLPLIAILRGIQPEELCAHANALRSAGFHLIEVPLNSPDPLRSLALLAELEREGVISGAGTVVSLSQLSAVAASGVRMAISPHTDPTLIATAKAAGLRPIPGVMTPSDALAAAGAGATELKLFPADTVSPGFLRALRSVVSRQLRIFPVGGIVPDAAQLRSWLEAGAAGFGIGSALYQPGQAVAQTSVSAHAFVTAYRAAAAGLPDCPLLA